MKADTIRRQLQAKWTPSETVFLRKCWLVTLMVPRGYRCVEWLLWKPEFHEHADTYSDVCFPAYLQY